MTTEAAARKPHGQQGWDPFAPSPLAPMPEERSALERTPLRVVPAESAAPAAPTPAPETVTDGDTAQRTPHSAPEPAASAAPGQDGREAAETPHTAPETDPEDAPTALTESDGQADRAARIRAWATELWTPPRVLSERPASVIEVVAYAETGEWAAGDGKARTLGRLWSYLVAAPVSVLAYLLAWVVQRPGRTATVAVLAGLIWLAVLTS